MNLISCIKKGIRQSPMKKVQFKILISLEELSCVPYVNGVFFAKIRMVNSLKMPLYSEHKELIDHNVRWKSSHSILFKASIDATTKTLESKFLKITIKQETNGGKSSKTFGSVVVNVSSFANEGNKQCPRRYILASKNKNLRQANSLLQISIQMCQTFGDPCFRVPGEESANCLDLLHSQRSSRGSTKSNDHQHITDIVLVAEDNGEDTEECAGPDCVCEEALGGLDVPSHMVIKGHRRNISANIPLWLQPRNSGPIFADDMGLSQFEDNKRYHSYANCSDCQACHPDRVPAASVSQLQARINSTRGSRADIVDTVLRNCLETAAAVIGVPHAHPPSSVPL